MITDWVDILASGMEIAIYMSALALPLAAIVLAVDLLAGRFIAARYRCLLWTLVAVRMVTPMIVESSFSMHNLWSSDATVIATPNDRPKSSGPSSGQDHAQDIRMPVAPASSNEETKIGPNATRLQSNNHTAQPTAPAIDWTWVISRLLPLLWCLGVMVLASRPVLAAIRFTWSLRRCEEITDQRVIDILLRVCDRSGAGRRPKLKIVPELQTPAVFGSLRPTICLPPNTLDELSPDQLEMVFHHEVAHVRRRDAMTAWLATIVRAFHWMNPVAWLVHWKIMQMMEQSCDEAVLRRCPGQSARSYGELLMQLAADITPRGGRSALGLSFVRPIHRLGNRMKQLTKARRRNTWVRQIAAFGLLLATAATGFTDAKTIVTQPRDVQPKYHSRLLGYDRTRVSPYLEPHVERTYDVKSALVQLKSEWADTDAKKALSQCLPVAFDVECDLGEFPGQLHDGKLTVTAPEWIQHRIAGSLDALGRSGPWQILVSIRFISAPLDSVLKANIPWRTQGVVSDLPNTRQSLRTAIVPRADESDWAKSVENPLSIRSEPLLIENRPLVAIRITEKQRSLLMGQFRTDNQTTVLQAPKIAIFNGQAAVVSDESQSPFVVSVKPVHGTMATAMEPVIDVLSRGVRITLRAVVSENDRCELQLHILETSIDGVDIARLPFIDSNDQQAMQIQRPRGSGTMTKIACRLAREQSLLIASPQSMNRDSNTSQQALARFYLIETDWKRPKLR